jgi:predicted transcriptional regulator
MNQLEVPTPTEIENARQEAGLTQSELADAAGISQPAYAQSKSGNNDPRLSTIKRLTVAINKEL